MIIRRLRPAAIGIVVLACTLGLAAGQDVGAAGEVAQLTVDAAAPGAPVNRDLVGVGWHPGGQPLAVVDELEPRIVRIDASLQDLSPAEGQLDVQPLIDRVAEVRAVGGEPLVILSYMPAWLGGPDAFGRDATRVPPSDLDVWQQLIHDVVSALATAPEPALRFEAWNEPDIPIFWQDTPVAWSAMIERTARAISEVEAETGLDLEFGGPATAVPDPVYLAAFLTPLSQDPALPLDYVSWHYYGNTPFLGPDGNEFEGVGPVYPVIGRPNPVAGPAAYGTQVELMRQWTSSILVGSGRAAPELAIDEWNLSPGGFDHRHDDHEGAAFTAGVLIEMQQAALDESAFFQVDDEDPPGADVSYGGHGLVSADGRRKPSWWALWLWQQQARDRLAVHGVDPAAGLWATASSGPDRITFLAASFSASRPQSRTLDIRFDRVPWESATATVRRLDGTHPEALVASPEPFDGDRVRVELPEQGVVFVEVVPSGGATLTGPAGARDGASSSGSSSGAVLPATGGSPTLPAATALAVAAAGVIVARRWRA